MALEYSSTDTFALLDSDSEEWGIGKPSYGDGPSPAWCSVCSNTECVCDGSERDEVCGVKIWYIDPSIKPTKVRAALLGKNFEHGWL